MTALHERVDAALSSLRALLQADGYDLETVSAGPVGIVLKITANEGACADCLVPSGMMTLYVRDALKAAPDAAELAIELIYPQSHV